jgi:hypothetical protein
MDSGLKDQRAPPASASGTAPIPAPYGRACLSCAKAKCKCLTRSGSNSCERPVISLGSA